MRHRKRSYRRLGISVFAALVALKGIEFVIGVSLQSGAALLVALSALVSAVLILNYFMHIQQLWHGGES